MDRLEEDNLTIPEHISEGFRAVIVKTMALKITDRYQDVMDIKRDLQQHRLIDSMASFKAPQTHEEPKAAISAAPVGKKKKWVALTASAAFCAVILTVALLYFFVISDTDAPLDDQNGTPSPEFVREPISEPISEPPPDEPLPPLPDDPEELERRAFDAAQRIARSSDLIMALYLWDFNKIREVVNEAAKVYAEAEGAVRCDITVVTADTSTGFNSAQRVFTPFSMHEYFRLALSEGESFSSFTEDDRLHQIRTVAWAPVLFGNDGTIIGAVELTFIYNKE
jgi:hypothetical protein